MDSMSIFIVKHICRSDTDNPSFETKQKILRLVVERIDFVNDQITIRHVIPVSAGPPADRQLRRNCLHKLSDTPRLTVVVLFKAILFVINLLFGLFLSRHMFSPEHYCLGLLAAKDSNQNLCKVNNKTIGFQVG